MFIMLLHIHNDLIKQGNIWRRRILGCTNKPHLQVQKSTVKNQNDKIFDFLVSHTENE